MYTYITATHCNTLHLCNVIGARIIRYYIHTYRLHIHIHIYIYIYIFICIYITATHCTAPVQSNQSPYNPHPTPPCSDGA